MNLLLTLSTTSGIKMIVTAILGGVIVSTFLTMFYLEDRDGVGVYDPDPSASYRHRNHK